MDTRHAGGSQYSIIQPNWLAPRRLLTGILIFIACGCNRKPTDNIPQSKTNPRIVEPLRAQMSTADTPNHASEAPVSLQLATLGRPQQTGIRLRLTVANNTSRAIRWDGQFAALLRWAVYTDSSEMTATTLQSMTFDRGSIATRFVEIAPHSSLSRDFDLTSQFVEFWHARRSVNTPDGGSVVVPEGGEDMVRFDIKEDIAAIRVRVRYEGDDDDAADGFAVYYGVRPEAIGLPRIGFESNEVAIKLSARPPEGSSSRENVLK